MARKKIYYDWHIPSSVVKIVTAYCADYDRRAKLISDVNTTECCLNQYKLINSIIDKALDDIEVGIRRDMLYDISLGRGYFKSNCCVFIDKNSYYRRRRKLVHDIAVYLHLID